jgi:4a-hydroxytetrahydrobiopterin dehydratase
MSNQSLLRVLRPTEIVSQLAQVAGWRLTGDGPSLHIEKTFHFPGYYETISFVNAVAFMAQASQHHPELVVHFDRCTVRYQTHDVAGLSSADFAAAARVDALLATT